jgi:hypothetical protein
MPIGENAVKIEEVKIQRVKGERGQGYCEGKIKKVTILVYQLDR